MTTEGTRSESQLPGYLEGQRAAILAAAGEALRHRRLPSYLAAGDAEVERRLAALFDQVVAGAATRRLDGMIAHGEAVGHERTAEGAALGEVQAAFHVLEGEVWHALVDGFPPAELGHALGLVATLLGAARDRVAETYVAHAAAAHAPTLDLRSLFRGADETGA